MILDFKDKNATINPSEVSPARLFLHVLPALLGLATVMTNFWAFLFSGSPYLLVWVKFIVIGCVWLLTIITITAKRKHPAPVASSLLSHTGGTIAPTPVFVYHYPQVYRRVAKWSFFLLLLLLGWAGWDAMPCGLFNRTIMGKVISTSDSSLAGASIVIMGTAGDVISRNVEILDDDSFFCSDLKWWCSKPYQLVIYAGHCPVEHIAIADYREVLQQNKMIHYWSSICHAHGK